MKRIAGSLAVILMLGTAPAAISASAFAADKPADTAAATPSASTSTAGTPSSGSTSAGSTASDAAVKDPAPAVTTPLPSGTNAKTDAASGAGAADASATPAAASPAASVTGDNAESAKGGNNADAKGASVKTTSDMSPAVAAPQTTPTTGTSQSASESDVGASSPAHGDAAKTGSAANNKSTSAAATEENALPDLKWSFDGVFGTYDKGALQRGFQIYSQVCSSCHSMNRLSYRNLTALGYSEEEVKAIAASHTVHDGPNDEGEMFDRPGLPSDHFVAPFPNKQAAASANNGAAPPDMSLLVKAREGGPSYVYGILNGYEEPPAGASVPKGRYWNKYMPGHVIAMPPPLQAGQVAYEDNSPQTLNQYASDVATFLAWASEPHMEERKRTGIKVFLFLLVFAGIMFGVKKKVWAAHH